MQTMNKTTSPQQGKPEFWPGTRIVKSKDNGFTRPAGPSLMASAAEETRARKLAQEAANSHEAQKARGRGFGHATLGGLSIRAQKQLKDAPHSISLDPSNNRGARLKKAAI